MTDSELEIAKKIAESEGLKVELIDPDFDTRYYAILVNKKLTEYNPFNWSILGPLMLKHVVTLHRVDRYVAIYPYLTDDCNNYIDRVIIRFSDETEIPRAILECIIKSQDTNHA